MLLTEHGRRQEEERQPDQEDRPPRPQLGTDAEVREHAADPLPAEDEDPDAEEQNAGKQLDGATHGRPSIPTPARGTAAAGRASRGHGTRRSHTVALVATRLAFAVAVAGCGVLLVAAIVELVSGEPGMSLVDAYWIGRLPWTPIGVGMALFGATARLSPACPPPGSLVAGSPAPSRPRRHSRSACGGSSRQ